MLNEKIKAIIFDFFGVICHEVHQSWFDEHRNKFNLTQDEYSENSHKVDLGIITEKGFISFYSRKTNIPENDIQNKFNSYIKIDNNLIDLIKDLKKKYKIGLLSSASSEFIREIINKNNLENIFDNIIISSEVGLIKPDPEIYKLSLKNLGVLPEEVIFIDDRQKNIDGAEAVGIKSILYKDLNDLKLKLGC